MQTVSFCFLNSTKNWLKRLEFFLISLLSSLFFGQNAALILAKWLNFPSLLGKMEAAGGTGETFNGHGKLQCGIADFGGVQGHSSTKGCDHHLSQSLKYSRRPSTTGPCKDFHHVRVQSVGKEGDQAYSHSLEKANCCVPGNIWNDAAD